MTDKFCRNSFGGTVTARLSLHTIIKIFSIQMLHLQVIVNFETKAFKRIDPYGPSVIKEFDEFINSLDTPTSSNKLSALETLKSLGEYGNTAEFIAKNVYANMRSSEFVSGDEYVRNGMKNFIQTKYCQNIFKSGLLIDNFNDFLEKTRIIPQIMLGTINMIRVGLENQGKKINYLGGFESTPLMAILNNDLLADAYEMQQDDEISSRELAEKMVRDWQSKKIIPDDGPVQFGIFASYLSNAIHQLKKLELSKFTNYKLEETIHRCAI